MSFSWLGWDGLVEGPGGCLGVHEGLGKGFGLHHWFLDHSKERWCMDIGVSRLSRMGASGLNQSMEWNGMGHDGGGKRRE